MRKLEEIFPKIAISDHDIIRIKSLQILSNISQEYLFMLNTILTHIHFYCIRIIVNIPNGMFRNICVLSLFCNDSQ